MKQFKTFLKKIILVPRKTIIFLITVYQKTLSPDHGWLKARHPNGYCRYHPSCSEYAKQAFQKYGFLKGSYLTVWRILRCNPWSKGGEDELR